MPLPEFLAPEPVEVDAESAFAASMTGHCGGSLDAFRVERQLTDNSCWAAVSVSVAGLTGVPSKNQRDLIAALPGGICGEGDCMSLPGSCLSLCCGLKKLGVFDEFHRKTFQSPDICRYLSKKVPLCCVIFQPGTTAHCVVLSGCSGNDVRILDPERGSTSMVALTYLTSRYDDRINNAWRFTFIPKV